MKKLLLALLLLLTACSPVQQLNYNDHITLEIGTPLNEALINLKQEATFDDLDTFKLGTFNIKFRVEDKSYPLKVTIEDTQKPVVKTLQPLLVFQNETVDISKFLEVTDNSQGTISMQPTTIDSDQIGIFDITLLFTDEAGNQTILETQLEVIEPVDLQIHQHRQFAVKVGTKEITLSDYFTASLPLSDSNIVGDYDLNKAGFYPVQVHAIFGQVETSISVIMNVYEDTPLDDGYSVVEPAELRDDKFILVNKRYALPKSYVPANLVDVPEEDRIFDQPITQETLDAYLEMRRVARVAGHDLLYRSGYRSYELQESVYNGYLQTYTQAEVDSFSARPGHSEHQLGTTIDFCEGTDYCFGDFEGTPTQEWMTQNAHLYGFILRYPENMEAITGYQYEPWHYRFVGKEVAIDFFESGLTFDEYYQQFPHRLK